MATSRTSERIRYRYGICLNDNCEKCKSKEIQEIPARKDFVCTNPECGKPLRECPPPKKGGNKKLIGIIAAVVVVLAIIGGIFALGGNGGKVAEEEPLSVQTVNVEDKAEDAKPAISEAETKEQPKVEEAKPQPTATNSATASSGTKDLGYAIFRGTLKNGQPNDVNGRMEFKQQHQIDSRDSKKRVAEVGDYVIGEYSEGHLVQGIWYGSDNQVKGSIIIGK